MTRSNETNATSASNATMDKYTEALYDVFRASFEEALSASAVEDARWKRLMTSLDELTLLDFHMPSPFKPEPLDVDESRLDDARYRRYLIRKLKAPRPGKWVRHKLSIDRRQIVDSEYRGKIAKVLAYRFVQLLLPLDSFEVVLPVIKLGATDLEYLLGQLRLNDLSARRVSDLLMRRLARSFIEENEKFQEVSAMIRARGAEARERLAIELHLIEQEVMESFSLKMSEVRSHAARVADRTIAEMRVRSAEQSERTARVLAESALDPLEDREVTFRQTVLASEEARRQERREAAARQPLWLKLLKRASVVAGGYVLTFHVKIKGLTLVEWLEIALAV
ncbi:MAG: hypothetical protein KC777_30105 [Cyanobacteria bacterium HKST-UBA02]|nr:hypothetical protein [Cyanobacteria bacterium HKST-UBA02]